MAASVKRSGHWSPICAHATLRGESAALVDNGLACYRSPRRAFAILKTVSNKAKAVLRIEQLFQYILACAAGADDFRERELGAIHLLKYAYLADLAYAKGHDGSTYTGMDWRFHHFGPWSADAHDRIRPSLVDQAGATARSIPSLHGDDYVRYRFSTSQANQIEAALTQTLPLVVSGALARAVHQHGSDTADLLRQVYLTSPMLAARPSDVLDFTSGIEPSEPPAPSVPRARRSKAETRRRTVALVAGRAKIQQLVAKRRSTRVAPDPQPRYDDVFFSSLEKLDREAGVPPKGSSGMLSFDDSVWSSSQRRDPEIP